MADTAHLPKLDLNLLYPQGLPLKLHIRFLKWLLTFGRYIAVLVEVLVLVAFAARFKFDADLADIKERINQQIPFIESLQTQEILIRQTQFKLATIKSTVDATPTWSEIFKHLSNQTPAGVSLTSFGIDHSQPTSKISFKMAGEAISNNDLAVFVYGLKNDDFFANINLANVSFEEGLIVFTITGESK